MTTTLSPWSPDVEELDEDDLDDDEDWELDNDDEEDGTLWLDEGGEA